MFLGGHLSCKLQNSQVRRDMRCAHWGSAATPDPLARAPWVESDWNGQSSNWTVRKHRRLQ